MAPQPAPSVALLRALTYRISSSSTKELPSIIPQLTAAIWNCKDLLSTPIDAKQNSETSVVVHRFKTQLSTLLQDRSIEGRWAAVVLVKSTIEAGGLELLSKCNAWVKNLLGILKRPDPSTTRTLTVLTLTRIFMLTWDYSTLVREITTPALTAFVPTCLSNIENKRCSATELETVLGAFSTLLPRHPTIFRTNESKLRTFLNSILSTSSSGLESAAHYTQPCRHAAGQILVQLHSCAPKQGSSDKWAETLHSAVLAAHAACDRIFRAVHEDWQSLVGVESSTASHVYTGEVGLESIDAAGLKPWKGIYAGSERLISLLGLISSHHQMATTGTVPARVGLITDLLTRIFAVTLPHHGNQDFIKINNQISKDEREALFAVIPSLHVAAMEVCETMVQRFGSETIAWVQSLIEHTQWVFRAERNISEIRVAVYRLLSSIISIVGPSLSKGDVAELAFILEACCVEVLPSDQETTSPGAQNGGGIKQQLGLTGSNSAQSYPTETSNNRNAAVELLRVSLEKIEAPRLPPKLRAQIDRVAVLSRNEVLLFSSVLNPYRKQSEARVQPSLLPILAREFGDRSRVETLLRPRMPPIRTKMNGNLEEDDEFAEDDIAENDATMNDDVDKSAVPDSMEPTAFLGAAQSEPELEPPETTSIESFESQAGKRPAVEDARPSSPAKRPRASPIAESLLPDPATALPGSDPPSALKGLPVAVSLPPPSEKTVTLVTSGAQSGHEASDIPGNTGPAKMDDEGDDSDFEMPPLTMEPDTDPEDEGDEEED